ncbi:hypothetical protein ACS0TY_029570 [Phlomoides rotata]
MDRAKAKWKGKVCPRISKIMEINMEKLLLIASLLNAMIDIIRFHAMMEVLATDWLSLRIHGHCAILKQKLDPEDFVHDYYSVETYLKAYEHPILGISYDALWGDSMYIPPLPPNFGTIKRRGRIPTMRRKEPDEPKGKKKSRKLSLRRQQTSLHCLKCGGEGHNAATCLSQSVRLK